MRGLKKMLVGVVAVVICMMGVLGVGGQLAWADSPCPDGQVYTSILGGGSHCVEPGGDQVKEILFLIVRVLVYGLGAAAVLGVVIAGIYYLTARDNEQQVVVAKRRLFEIALGLVAWALLYVVVNWLIPGGMNMWDSL